MTSHTSPSDRRSRRVLAVAAVRVTRGVRTRMRMSTGSLALAVACLLALAPTSRALTVTSRIDNMRQQTVSGPQGLGIYTYGSGNSLASAEIIDYGHATVTLLDGATKRSQTLPLALAVARAVAQRKITSTLKLEDVEVETIGRARAHETSRHRRIKGVLARAWVVNSSGGQSERVWYATTAPPPRAVSALLAQVAPVGGARLLSEVPLLIEQRVGRRWVKVSVARRVTHTHRLTTPRGFRRGTVLPPVAQITARPHTTPAHVSVPFAGGYFPVATHQAVFTVFQGARFAHEPAVVSALNHAISSVIEAAPYDNGLAQYGVRAGHLVGSVVHPSDPPFAIGQTSAAGFLAGLPIVTRARLRDGAPFSWTRVSDAPLVVVFVPAESVDPADNTGYHSVVPFAASLLDPFGFIQLQVYPYTIVKVPPPTDPNAIDKATETLSHEAVEAATDPVDTGWIDATQASRGSHDEIADICHEGDHSPWGDNTKISGVAVATYWSNADSACVPESRPTVHILSPTSGASVAQDHGVGFSGSATDPFDGALIGTHLQWSDDVAGPLQSGANIIAQLTAGIHHVTLTATDDAGLTQTATITITVVAGAPTARIDGPADGSSFASDQTIPLLGSAHDPQDGDLSGSSLAWRVLHGSTQVATPASGSPSAFVPPGQGDYTIELTATDHEGVASVPATVTVHVGPPAGNPSPMIDTPTPGQRFYSGTCTSTVNVTFDGQATDPSDGTLTGDSLVWYLNYGTPSQVEIGTGTDFSYPVPQSCTQQASYTVTLVATDSNLHTASTSVTITTGAPT
jgi:hypothetical protein